MDDPIPLKAGDRVSVFRLVQLIDWRFRNPDIQVEALQYVVKVDRPSDLEKDLARIAATKPKRRWWKR